MCSLGGGWLFLPRDFAALQPGRSKLEEGNARTEWVIAPCAGGREAQPVVPEIPSN
jgi:hypothetical protein